MFTIKRAQHNPLISPVKEHGWEELATCNGCPAQDGETLHMLYRAMETPDRLGAAGLNRSVVGYAKSTDGIHFEGRRPFIIPTEPWERFGCEDPRITKIDDTYYIFYTGLSNFPLSPEAIKIGVAITKDCEMIEEKHLVTPFNGKAMALFPERIDGKLVAILTANTDSPPGEIAIATFETNEDLWNQQKWNDWYAQLDEHKINLRRNDNEQVEVGAPPVKTDKGWLLIYSHIQNYYSDNKIFGIEAVLLDLKDPRKVIGRTQYPLMVPETMYERYGLVSNVVFPTGALIRDDVLDIYYGGADTTCCKASVSLSALLNELDSASTKTEVTRFSNNPILMPTEKTWEKRLVLNPAAVDIDGDVYVMYRAMADNGTSTFGLAISSDGLHIDERLPEPIYIPREDFEMKKTGDGGYSGCEDPRITRIGDVLYVCYTAYDGVNVPRVAVTSITVDNFVKRDWSAWKKPVLLSPRGIDDKDACIMPEKIGGNYMIMHRIDSHICADVTESLDFMPGQVDTCIEILEPRLGMWDSKKVGIAGPPHKTEKGWLLFYHGVSEEGIYRMGAALLELDNPSSVIARTDHALLEPKETWEKEGEVNNVVFPCGSVIRDDTVFIYYGGADKVVGVATLSLSKTLQALIFKGHE